MRHAKRGVAKLCQKNDNNVVVRYFVFAPAVKASHRVGLRSGTAGIQRFDLGIQFMHTGQTDRGVLFLLVHIKVFYRLSSVFLRRLEARHQIGSDIFRLVYR